MSKCFICGKNKFVIYNAPILNDRCCKDCYTKIKLFYSNTNNDLNVNNNSNHGKCSRCTSCCTDFIPMTNDEIKIIKSYMKTHEIIRTYATNDNNELYIACPFLSDNGCQIYEVRPQVCRDFGCWKSKRTLVKNKIINSCKADVNDKPNNYISLHQIFFNDKKYSNYLLEQIKKGNVKYE